MKIKSIHGNNLRNDEHFQFHTEVQELIKAFDAEKLSIPKQFQAYQSCYVREDEAYKKILKSALTRDIEAADQGRDLVFSGMAGTNRAALKHFNPDVAAAAYRLQILFDTYGNLADKPLNEETSAIYNLLQELNGKYAKDAQAAGLKEWIAQLEVENKSVEALIMKRDDENSVKTHLIMKECRLELDRAYTSIVELVNALIVVEGESKYAAFVDRFNTCIDRYSQLIARRKGNKDGKQGDEETSER